MPKSCFHPSPTERIHASTMNYFETLNRPFRTPSGELYWQHIEGNPKHTFTTPEINTPSVALRSRSWLPTSDNHVPSRLSSKPARGAGCPDRKPHTERRSSKPAADRTTDSLATSLIFGKLACSVSSRNWRQVETSASQEVSAAYQPMPTNHHLNAISNYCSSLHRDFVLCLCAWARHGLM